MKNNLKDTCTPCGVARTGTFDFHVHTCLSDGAADQTPEEVCRQAAEAGLTHMAITDHDWMLDKEDRIALSAAWGLDVIAGCEFSAQVFIDNKPHIIHIGGHWLDEDDPRLWEVLRCNQKQDYEGYVKEMLSRCLRYGLDPSHEGVDRSYEMILERNPNSHHLGKQAVSSLLCETGCVASRQEVRDKYLSAHGERLAYVSGEEFFHFAPLEAVMHAVNSSGLSTLNHLYYYRLERAEEEELMRRFRDLGGQAMEVFYPVYSKDQQAELLRHCETYGFLPNCGSDRHTREKDFLQGDPALFERLRDRCRKLHGHIWGGADHGA